MWDFIRLILIYTFILCIFNNFLLCVFRDIWTQKLALKTVQKLNKKNKKKTKLVYV